MSIATVTFNPAIDQTVTLGRLVPGQVHRASAVRSDVGGKGVNVASLLADWGLPVMATGLLGRDNAQSFEALFAAKRIEDRFVRVAGETRTNLKLVDACDTTDINLPGPIADAAAIARVAAALDGDHALVVLAGSLPRGCDDDLYAGLVARLAARGCRVLLDASGAPLDRALAAAVLPYCIKPNRVELAEHAGRPLATIADLAAEAERQRARGIALVVVSMGADGALFCSDEGVVIAQARAAHVASTVGAGDAMVAGIAAALAEGAGLERIARLATAFAIAKLGRAGPHLPDRAEVEALAQTITITDSERAGEQA